MLDQDTPTQAPATGKLDLGIAVAGRLDLLPGIGSFARSFTEAMRGYIRSQGLEPVTTRFSGLTASIVDVRYPVMRRLNEQPVDLLDIEYVNDGPVEQEIIWSRSTSTAVEASISVTAGLEAGAEANFGIPEIGLGVGIDVRSSLSTTSTQTRRVEQSWSWTVPIRVPPFSAVRAVARLSRVRYELGFQARVRINGNGRSCEGTGLRLPNLRTFFNTPGGWVRTVGIPGYTADGATVLYDVAGTMQDVQGTGISIATRVRAIGAPDGDEGAVLQVIEDADSLPHVESFEIPAEQS